MVEADYGTFERAFKRVSGAFRLRMSKAEASDLTGTYFKLLTEFPLDAVLLAARLWMERNKRMPTASDWRDTIEDNRHRTAPITDHRQMTVAEANEYAYAASVKYTEAPCTCLACQAAGVEAQPLRFVPTEAGEDFERVSHPYRPGLQIAGHWAHGEDLARWYTARAAFYALAVKHPIALRLVMREPGEDD